MNKKYRLDVIAPEHSNSEGARDKKALVMSHAIYLTRRPSCVLWQ